MLGIDMWVKWHGHGRWTPPPGQEFHCNAPKIFLAVHFILCPPQKHFFQNGQCFRDCKPSEIYISWSILYKCETLEAYISLHIDFFYIFCLAVSEGDALLVKYISCKFCMFLRSTGKHYICSTQKSDIVWCDIFISYCSFNQHGEQNPTEVFRFLFYISHLTENYKKMQMILFIVYSWTFLSFSISIFILCICYH